MRNLSVPRYDVSSVAIPEQKVKYLSKTGIKVSDNFFSASFRFCIVVGEMFRLVCVGEVLSIS